MKTDPYLDPKKAFYRLLDEYQTHGSLYVGYDFDSTVHDFHKIGTNHEKVIKLLQDLKELGCVCHCWTAYKDHDYVIEFCKEKNIPCDGVNINAIPLSYETRKPFYSVLLDDRAGLLQVYDDLTLLVSTIKQQNNYKNENITNS